MRARRSSQAPRRKAEAAAPRSGWSRLCAARRRALNHLVAGSRGAAPTGRGHARFRGLRCLRKERRTTTRRPEGARPRLALQVGKGCASGCQSEVAGPSAGQSHRSPPDGGRVNTVCEEKVTICRSFFWVARDRASGGSCAVAWETVCTPKWTGGLGLPNLKWLNVALMTRWLWLRRVDGDRPWTEFQIAVPPESLAIYRAAVFVDIGSGTNAFFFFF